MKSMILTCNTGAGHNSSSIAVKQAFDDAGATCDIVDSLSFISERMSRFICKWHTRLYRHAPRAFSEGYSFFQGRSAGPVGSSVLYKYLSSGIDKLYRLILEEGYDQVICAHVFAAVMVSKLMQKYGRIVQTSFVDTDYTCHPFTGDCDMDIYFIPHEDVADEFIACGVPADRIVVTGIPVSQAYYSSMPKETAKARLGIAPSKRNILVMGGSMGCGPVEELVPKLLAALPEDCVVSVVCGTNRNLFRVLSKDHPKNLHLYEFTNKIAVLMDSAELLVTKPGGISVTEAAVKGLPLVLLDVVGGCETYNLEFFVSRGWAQEVDASSAAGICRRLLDNEAELMKLRERMKADFDKNAAKEICNFCLSRVFK